MVGVVESLRPQGSCFSRYSYGEAVYLVLVHPLGYIYLQLIDKHRYVGVHEAALR